jgi:hypothetical protein
VKTILEAEVNVGISRFLVAVVLEQSYNKAYASLRSLTRENWENKLGIPVFFCEKEVAYNDT